MLSLVAESKNVVQAPAVEEGSRPLRVLSNIPDLEKYAPPEIALTHRLIEKNAGRWAAFRLFFVSFRYDILLLDCNPPYLSLLCLLRWFWPFGRCRLISLDIQLNKPASRKQRLATWINRQLFKRVDHFIHYFKDLEGYSRWFGITPQRSTYVPFKVNGWEKIPPADQLSAEGTYVFTGGRSLRDLDTFVEAMRRLPHPAILLHDDPAQMVANGSPFRLPALPSNVRAVQHDGVRSSWLEHFKQARVIVVTTLGSSIRSNGISTYLEAMGWGKCVVMTEGPATRDILADEAILVPPADPVALAAAIERAWTDADLRKETAAAGRRYAEQVAGTPRLLGDVLRTCAGLVPVRCAK